MSKGTLIVIEGADGSGKATQTERLVKRLMQEGHEVETLDFPQYEKNVFGQLLKECLSGQCGNFMDLDPRIASALYAADRFESKDKLLAWLKEGKLVVLDRYSTSNMLHQGAKSAGEAELTDVLHWIEKVEYEVFGVPRPDLVIYLDVPADERRRLGQKVGKNDLAERHVAHQVAADEVGRLAGKKFGWTAIECMRQGELRSIEDIAEEVYHHVVPLIQR